MNPHLTYLALMLGTIAFPLSASWDRRVSYARTWPMIWPGMLVTAALFIGLDALFTEWKIWGFNDDYILGPRWLGLPIEEWAFFFCVPFSCLFIYECIGYYFKGDVWRKAAPWITGILVIGMTAVALGSLDRTYTSVKLLMAVAVLLGHLAVFRFRYLGKFYLGYAFTLIPFLIVNGVLTSMPVVWYDDSENLGIRYNDLLPIEFINIPIEDTFYGMTLILMNVSFLEYFRERKTSAALLP